MFLIFLCLDCDRKSGIGSNKHRSSQQGFFSGGQWSVPCQLAPNGPSGRYFCICFLPLYRAIFFPDFSSSATAWFTQCFYLHHNRLASLLSKTSNAQAR